MNPLIPCPECARHVRASETSCPFCRASLDLANAADAVLPAERLGRAGVLGFQALVRAGVVAATSGALIACSDLGAPTPLYGAPGVGGTTATGGIGGRSSAGAHGGGTSGIGGAGARAGDGGTAGVSGGGTSSGGTANAGGTGGTGGAAGRNGGAGSAGEVSNAGEGGDGNEGGAGGEGGR